MRYPVGTKLYRTKYSPNGMPYRSFYGRVTKCEGDIRTVQGYRFTVQEIPENFRLCRKMRLTPKQQAAKLEQTIRDLRGYDHIHWSIVNSRKILSPRMGSLSDPANKKDSGKILLLGRNSTGHHNTLFGPITQRQFQALTIHFTRYL